MQGAVGAAVAAKDMSQAETWLRQALDRFPTDAGVLGVAARFEQARGNNQRATEFWRAALAAAPAGSSAQKLSSGSAFPSTGNLVRRTPRPGELKQLLDPGSQSPDNTGKLPAYPSSGPGPYNGVAAGSQPLAQPGSRVAASLNSSLPNLPLPITSVEQGTAPSQPVFIEQSSNKAASIWASQSNSANREANPVAGLRIASQPMDSIAANAQAQFADQTDGQLMQGSATAIHAIPNAPAAVASRTLAPSNPGQYAMAQYTPSAQEAATGAYSAQRQQTAQSPSQAPLPKTKPLPVERPATQPQKGQEGRSATPEYEYADLGFGVGGPAIHPTAVSGTGSGPRPVRNNHNAARNLDNRPFRRGITGT